MITILYKERIPALNTMTQKSAPAMNHLYVHKTVITPHHVPALPGYCRRVVCLAFLFVCLCVTKSFGQAHKDTWETVVKEYQSGVIPDTVYMNKVRELVTQSFKEKNLKQKLEQYRTIAWSRNEYGPYRVKYFSFLANNAVSTHKEGIGIYYIQKSEEELKKIPPYINSLNEPKLLLALYNRNKKTNIPRRQAIFEHTFPFIKTLPRIMATQKVPAATCINAMTILAIGARLYSDQKDTTRVFEIFATSEAICNNLKNRVSDDVENLEQGTFTRYQIKSIVAQMRQDKNALKKILDTSYVFMNALASDIHTNQAWRRSATRFLLRQFIDYYIAQHQIDSSRHYLHLLEQLNMKNDPGDGTAYLLYSSKVDAVDTHFKQAYTDLLQAYEINDSVISLKTADINDNMYAQMMSEQSSAEIIQLKEQRQKRNTIIGISALMVLGLISALVLQLRNKEKRFRKRVEELNKMTQMQIAELETKANLIQRKLGMELHDDIAGRLVHICNFIQKEILDEPDEKKREQLSLIGTLAKDTYNSTRNKSHEWYSEGLKEEWISFSESVHKLAEYALPEDRVEKEIAIDDSSLEHVSHSIRIQLLRIIQEAMVNILKHAHASKVRIFIYQEEDDIVLQIKDNGRGFDNNKPISRGKGGIGLQSLRERVADMKGAFELSSSKNGTELIVTLPI